MQVDSWDPNDQGDDGFEPPDQMTYLDAMALMKAGKAYRQVASNRSGLVLEPQGEDERPFSVDTRNTWADFFPMFDLPFLYGSGWDDSADRNLERVVVLSKEINERIFGGENSVGRNVRLNGMDFRVVGVMDEFLPVPKFYDVTNDAFGAAEELFIPFNVAVEYEFPRNGNTNCWKKPDGDGLEAFLNSECAWIQFWAELRNDAEKQDYMAFLNAYVEQQKQLGRFPRPLNNQLSDVMEWMEKQEVVADDARVMLGLSLLFLAVCLLNTIGLLLAKFLGKSADVSLRRALGASRSSLFMQYMIESAMIGLGGGIFGLNLLAGENFTATDIQWRERGDTSWPDKTIITRAMAEALYPDDPDGALGKTVYINDNDPLTITGIIAQMQAPWNGWDGVERVMLTPNHTLFQGTRYIIRAEPGRRDELMPQVEKLLAESNKDRIVRSMRSMDETRERSYRGDSSMIRILSFTIILLLAITSLGIVGLASFSVNRRTRQIGTRRALGATKVAILRYFMTENFLISLVGVLLGAILTVGLNILMIETFSLTRIAWYLVPFAMLMLLAVGQVAVFGPAKKASSVPPAVATRTV